MGPWPVQVCAAAIPLPVRQISSGLRKKIKRRPQMHRNAEHNPHTQTHWYRQQTQSQYEEATTRRQPFTGLQQKAAASVLSTAGEDCLCTQLHRAGVGSMSNRKDHLTLVLMVYRSICSSSCSTEMKVTDQELAKNIFVSLKLNYSQNCNSFISK